MSLSSKITPLHAIAWGGLLLYWSLSDQLDLFLHPTFKPWVMAAGVGLLLFGIGVAEAGEESCCDESRPTWKSLLPSLLALAAVAMVPHETLSWQTLAKRGAATNPITPALPENFEVPEGKVLEIDLVDLATASVNPTLRQMLQGKTVSIMGQYVEQDGPHLLRLIMWCCAADAQPVLVALRDLPTPPPRESWVKVIGTLQIGEMGEPPTVQVQEVHPIQTPEDPYAY